MRKSDQRPRRRNLLADDRHVGVDRIPLGASPAVMMISGNIENDIGAGRSVVLASAAAALDTQLPRREHEKSAERSGRSEGSELVDAVEVFRREVGNSPSAIVNRGGSQDHVP